MCARYSLAAPPEVIAALFGVSLIPGLERRYNIAPTQSAPVVRAHAGQRSLAMLRWGLVPAWADDPKIGNRLINARSEEIDTKPAFRTAFRRRRCLVPTDGFYEWQSRGEGQRKQPYRIRLKGGEPFALAGLWEHWQAKEGGDLETFTVLTTEPNDLTRPLHNRMPVILPPESWPQWLDENEQDPARLKPLLGPFNAAAMEAYPVPTRVNSPANDDPLCIEPVAAVPPENPDLFGNRG